MEWASAHFPRLSILIGMPRQRYYLQKNQVGPRLARRNIVINGLRLHDLRHTLASWQAAAGTSLAIIGKGLGHTQVSTTQRYAHLDSDPVREAMSRAIKGMTDAGNKKKKSP